MSGFGLKILAKIRQIMRKMNFKTFHLGKKNSILCLILHVIKIEID